MGITPIKDAGGILNSLTTKLSTKPAESVLPGAGGTGNSVDFQSVWKSQAGMPNGGKEAENLATPKETTVKDRTSEATDPKESSAEETKKEPAPAAKGEKASNADKTDTSGKAAADAEGTDGKDVQSIEADPKQTTIENNLTEEELGEAQEILMSLVANLTETIAGVLEITPEEVQGVLETEGLAPTDLLDPGIFGEFLPRVMGAGDKLGVLTDETHYEAFKELTAELESLLKESEGFEGMTVTETLEAVRQTVAASEVPEVLTEEQTAPEQEAQIFTQTPQAVEKITTVLPAQETQETEEPKAKAPEQAPEQAPAEDAEIRSADLSDGQTLGARAMLRRDRQSREEEQGAGHQAAAQTPNQIPGQIEAQGAAQVRESFTSPQAQEIADQILDYIKSQVKEDFQSVEMQLHPASLGTLQISVANRGGVLTANFVTPNEQVRAVLETQMVQLQDQLKEQGVKVEAVVVTVAAHAFDQNLQQGSEQGNADERNASRSRTRSLRIGADLTDEDLAALEEEDRITAEMMQANGQSVDFKA